jgi:hypothetical protein
MKTLHLILASIMALAPVVPSQIQNPCVGMLYRGISYHDCLDGVYLTTSIWSGECGEGCPYIINVTIEIDDDCGGGWDHATKVGVLPCGGSKLFKFTYQGDTVAWSNVACSPCAEAVVGSSTGL